MEGEPAMRTALVLAAVLLVASAGVAWAQAGASSPAAPFNVGAEALLWWLKDSPAPVPLVTDGIVGQPGTRVFLGGRDLDTDPTPGFRLTAGYALTDRWGLESSFFYLPTRSTVRSVGSNGAPGSQRLVVPFFDVTLPGEDTTGIALPGQFAGHATEQLSTSFLGAELNAATPLRAMGPVSVDVLGGFRYLRLRDTYTFVTSSPNVPPRPADVFETTDELGASNDFYGAQIGARARFDRGPWFASGVLKVALGAVVQTVDVKGSVTTNDFSGFGPLQTFAGGYFALPTNIGEHRRSVFAVVPEVGLTAGYRLTSWASVFLGYTFLYVSDVARAPQQVNRTINPTQGLAYGGTPPLTLQGAAEPSFKFKSTGFWAHGLSAGLAVRF